MNQNISLNKILSAKLKANESILAINVQSIQQIEIIANLSKEFHKEVIVQFSAKYISYFDDLIGIKRILDRYQNFKYLYFHLDHCVDEKLITKCINWGFDSIMFDGSSFSIDQNIIKTSHIVALANKKGVLVEGEVGVVGGVEDGFGNNGSSVFNMEDALLFYGETKVDMLALGIGNAHGVYKSTANVNVNLLSIFQSRLNQKKANLVLHGATGLNDQQIHQAIEFGVVKVNYSTEFKILYQTVISQLRSNKIHDEIYFYNVLKSALKPAIRNIINKLGGKCI
jgi:fructose-bisphosphate aldolase class II